MVWPMLAPSGTSGRAWLPPAANMGFSIVLTALILVAEDASARPGGRSFNGNQKRRPKAHATIANTLNNERGKALREYVEKSWDESLYDREKSIVEDEGDIQRMLMMRVGVNTERKVTMIVDGELVAGEKKPPIPAEKIILPIPKRPDWKAGSTDKRLLAALEQEEFMNWRKELSTIEDIYDVTVTPYEKNPEYWRNLWRVVERSHVVVQVLDCRNPLLYRAPKLEEYIDEVVARDSRQVQKVIVLNKADLMPLKIRQQWSDYFKRIPGVSAYFFSASSAGTMGVGADQEEGEQEQGKAEVQGQDKDGNDIASGSACVGGCSVAEEAKSVDGAHGGGGRILSREELLGEVLHLGRMVQTNHSERVYVGFVGFPNVGKSSTVNALCGEKKVAESKSAGRTKHLQTILVGDHLCLCDSPGIVFPSVISSRAEMACGGMLSVHNLRDAMAPVQLICDSVPLSVMEKFYNTKISTTTLSRPKFSAVGKACLPFPPLPLATASSTPPPTASAHGNSTISMHILCTSTSCCLLLLLSHIGILDTSPRLDPRQMRCGLLGCSASAQDWLIQSAAMAIAMGRPHIARKILWKRFAASASSTSRAVASWTPTARLRWSSRILCRAGCRAGSCLPTRPRIRGTA